MRHYKLRRFIGWVLRVRLQANENFPGEAVEALRGAGHDVTWIRETHPGIADEEVLRKAVAEERIVVTFDKDFGELAFARRLPAQSGIILFRIRKQSPELIARRAVSLIASRPDWAGHFSVVEEDRVRMTELPK